MINNRQALNLKTEIESAKLASRTTDQGVIEILTCAGTGCMSSKSLEIVDKFKELIKENNLDAKVKVSHTGCFGFCEKGPIIKIMPDDIFYSKVTLKDVEKIFESHIINGEIVQRKLYRDLETKEYIEKESDIPFYKKQHRLALSGCGFINPDSIDEFIGFNGYQAMAKALLDMSQVDIIEEVIASGLRGRGGGGFPTGVKWKFTAAQDSEQRYVICNADEGDPGAFMDRSILEGMPHAIIEAMVIAGKANGATQGYVYIRAEYPTAIKRLQKAIDDAYELGLLGENILESGFNFDLEIRLGAGAFVCGEETALIASIEGERGMPRNKPPFPSVSGLWGKPTSINNVETYANLPYIINNGASEFAKIGTEKSTGTKVFALGGKINNSGLIEVPMGTTLREVIYEIGGGIIGSKEFKAVQTGGPSGGCLTKEFLDTPIDFDSLTQLGSMMGSGGMIVMDENNCMVDVARFYLDFTVEESCGKCTPCREGTKRLLEILEKISEGKGESGDIEKLEELGEMIKSSSLCGLGQTAPNPVLSTIKHFREEYEAHINDKKCPAGVCQELTEFFITDACTGCTLCARNCPVGCISGEVKEQHVIDTNTCICCGACVKACPKGAIITK